MYTLLEEHNVKLTLPTEHNCRKGGKKNKTLHSNFPL